MFSQIVVFWAVITCSLVWDNKGSDEHAASIFRVTTGEITMLPPSSGLQLGK
jgi:hypothetical protein